MGGGRLWTGEWYQHGGSFTSLTRMMKLNLEGFTSSDAVYSYLFMSVHLVIELLRLVVLLAAVPPPTSGGAAPLPQTFPFQLTIFIFALVVKKM